MDLEQLKELHETLPEEYAIQSQKVEGLNHDLRVLEADYDLLRAKTLLELKIQGFKGNLDTLNATVDDKTSVFRYKVIESETLFRKAKADLISLDKKIEGVKELSAFWRRENKTIPRGEIETPKSF
jgi:hypothetical protein